jgi:hypothetical protein
MRTFPYFAIVLLGMAPCFAQKPSVMLDIQVPESEFTVGTAIRLDVAVRNSMTEDLHVWKVSPDNVGLAEAYIDVEIRDSEGKSLPRADGQTVVMNGKKYVFPKSWMTRKGAYVKPNQELRDYILLSKVFDLSKPGTYTVSAKASFDSRDSGPEIKWIVAESNKVTFAVKQTGSP